MIFRIINHGSDDLVIDSIEVPVGFETIGSLPDVVAPGQIESLSVRLDTSVAAGYYAGEVKIFNNDLNESLHTFSVEGIVSDGSPSLILGLSQRDAYEGNVLVGNVRRTGSVNQAVQVSLTSLDTSEVTVPETVVIPAGERFAQFYFNTVADFSFDETVAAGIVASAAGHSAANNSIDVISLEFDAEAFDLIHGEIIGGDFDSIRFSDNNRLEVEPAIVADKTAPYPVLMEFSTQLPDPDVDRLFMQMESFVNAINTRVVIEAFDFEAHEFVTLLEGNSPMLESVASVGLPDDRISDFISELSNEVRYRVGWYSDGPRLQPTADNNWKVSVDHVIFFSPDGSNPIHGGGGSTANFSGAVDLGSRISTFADGEFELVTSDGAFDTKIGADDRAREAAADRFFMLNSSLRDVASVGAEPDDLAFGYFGQRVLGFVSKFDLYSLDRVGLDLELEIDQVFAELEDLD